MTKEKYNLYSLERTNELIKKKDLRVTRLFWFAMGFLGAMLLTIIIFYPNAN